MRKTYLVPLLALLCALFLASCKKKPSFVYPVYFGSGSGCSAKGICLHPPVDSTIPVTFTLLSPKLLQLSFRFDDLKAKQPGKVPDFYSKGYYSFDHPWKAPHIIDSILMPLHPIFIWHHLKFTLSSSHGIMYMEIPLDGTYFHTTVRFGHGSMCDGKSICGSGHGIQGVQTDFYYSKKAGSLALCFRMSELRGMQLDQANLFAPQGFVPPPGLPSTYTFDYPWTMTDPEMISGLCPGGEPITIPAGQQNEVTSPDGENMTFTNYLTPGSAPQNF
jgi:hypothetical protein